MSDDPILYLSGKYHQEESMDKSESVSEKQTGVNGAWQPRFLIITILLFAFLLLGFYTGTRYGMETATEAALEFLEYKAADPTEIDPGLIISEPSVVYSPESDLGTVKVFVDMQCPSCSAFLEGPLKAITDSNLYRIEFYDLPSDSHSYARLAAAYTRCAVSMGVDYLTYVGALNSDFSEWTSMLKESNVSEFLLQTALKYGADEDKMNLCVKGEDVYSSIDENAADAAALGISGTPSFIIGRTLISGPVSRNTFISMLKEFGE